MDERVHLEQGNCRAADCATHPFALIEAQQNRSVLRGDELRFADAETADQWGVGLARMWARRWAWAQTEPATISVWPLTYRVIDARDGSVVREVTITETPPSLGGMYIPPANS